MSVDTEIPANARFGSGATLEITQIERELQRLWKDAAENSTKSGGGPVVRACSMSLVAPCSNDLQFEHVATVVEQTALRQPCRAILVKIDLDNKKEEIDATVSTVCALGGPDQKRVCHEQIQIFAAAGSVKSIAPSVLALLVPDVPAYVWAPCEKLLATPILPELSLSADAILLDSHRYSEPFRALERANAIASAHPANRALENLNNAAGSSGGFGVLDLEWVRLQTYFDATATLFEQQGARAMIHDLRTLRIEFAAREVTAAINNTADAKNAARTTSRDWITPALYAGWFASRLGWTLGGERAMTSPGLAELQFEGAGGRRVTLVPRIANDRAGAILNIEFSSSVGRARIARAPGAETGDLSVEVSRLSGPANISYRFQTLDDAEALSRALTRAPRDIYYERAMPISMAFAPK